MVAWGRCIGLCTRGNCLIVSDEDSEKRKNERPRKSGEFPRTWHHNDEGEADHADRHCHDVRA